MDNQDNQIQEELSKVNINGEEFDPTEAHELINKGRQAREAETKYNITIDSIMPAYTKANEGARRATELEQELSEAKRTIEEFKSKQERGTDNQGDLAEAREAARKLGLTFQEDVQGKYLSRDEMEKYLDERDSRREAVSNILKEATDLEGKYNGEDGRPKFNKKVVLAYAQAYNSGSLQEAYEDMHADALKSWQDAQVAAKKTPGLRTLASQEGNKQPNEIKVTKDNVGDVLSEKLWGTN